MSLPESGLFLGLGDQPLGPLTRAELAEKARAGLPDGALLWFEGQPAWLPLKEHPDYAALLGAPAEPMAPAVEALPVTALVTASDDDVQDAIFGKLVKQSWAYFRMHERATILDDVFVGALVTASLDAGYMLIDITSDGANHFLRLEQPENQSRVYFQVRHLTQTLVSARVEGNRVAVIVGYSERTNDLGRLWSALKQEVRSGLLASPEPGTITFDADVNTGYVSVQIDLFLNIDDYIGEDLSTNTTALTRDVNATIHALRKYLAGRARRTA